MAADGLAFTFTVIDARGPSPHPVTWLTYQVVLPGVLVDGVGGMEEPTPPVGTVYHNRLEPVACKATAGWF